MATTTHHTHHETHTTHPEATIPADGNGQGIVSLVLGVLSITSMGLLTGIPAIIFGALSIKKHPNDKGMGLAGLIMGTIGTILSFIVLVFFLVLVIVGLVSDSRTSSYPYTSPYNQPSSRI